jgi:hypothetical protein
MSRRIRLRKPILSLCFVLAVASGCSRNRAPAPLPADQAPAVVEKAFKEADPQVKTAATEVVEALQRKDHIKAFFELQDLSSRSDLTPEQREAASRSMLSVNEQLRSAASQGDQQAAEALQAYRARK